jgi:hypothetical protein
MRKRTGLVSLAALLILNLPARAASPPVLKIPASPDRSISPESLLGADRSDVRQEDAQGDVTVYHGLPLLSVLEKSGVDTKTMPGQRRLATAIVVVTARDGYTVVFSAGELLMHRADPRVFLVAETAAGPLPENEGPVRLIVYGDRTRSSYALARIELKFLTENTPAKR